MAPLTPTALMLTAPTLFRQGLTDLLRKHCPQLLVTHTANATQAVELVDRHAYGLVVLDGQLMSQVRQQFFLQKLIPRMHSKYPEQKFLLLTENSLHKQTQYFALSPCHYLQVPRFVQPEALAAILTGWLDAWEASTGQHLPTRHKASVSIPFSSRELEVLRLVVADQCNAEIADNLCVSVRTVESHRRSLLQKAGTHTVAGLVAQALRQGWIA